MFKKYLSCLILMGMMISCSSGQNTRYTIGFERCDFGPIEREEIIQFIAKSVLKSPFLKSDAALQKSCKWVLGSMVNDSNEHINTTDVMESIRAKLMKEGKIKFIDHQFLNPTSFEFEAKQLGADVILKGRITNLSSNESEVSKNYYVINYQVVSLENSQILESGDFNSTLCIHVKNKERERKSIFLK